MSTSSNSQPSPQIQGLRNPEKASIMHIKGTTPSSRNYVFLMTQQVSKLGKAKLRSKWKKKERKKERKNEKTKQKNKKKKQPGLLTIPHVSSLYIQHGALLQHVLCILVHAQLCQSSCLHVKCSGPFWVNILRLHCIPKSCLCLLAQQICQAAACKHSWGDHCSYIHKLIGTLML
jgi:hypothetical protein